MGGMAVGMKDECGERDDALGSKRVARLVGRP